MIWPLSQAVKTTPFHGVDGSSTLPGVTKSKVVAEVMTEPTKSSKVCSCMRKTLLEPYKNEAGVSPRAAVEMEMPSGVRNLIISWAGAQLPNIWPRSQAVKTSASHAEDPGSIPGGVTRGQSP